jgi:hypothetical protein
VAKKPKQPQSSFHSQIRTFKENQKEPTLQSGGMAARNSIDYVPQESPRVHPDGSLYTPLEQIMRINEEQQFSKTPDNP